MKPAISVIMANYNNGKYIAEAIESVLNQSFEDWELVIIDDGSTDNSVDVIKRYVENERINFLQHDNNKGYIASLKRLTDETKADILLILDSDDALTDDALDLVFKTYSDHPDCGFVYSNFVFCDEFLNSKKIGDCCFVPDNKSNLNQVYTVALRSFKKYFYSLSAGYDEEILYAEDRDIIFKLEEVTKFYFIDKVLYKYRRLPNSQTLNPQKAEISKTSHILAKYKAFLRRQNTNIPNLTKKRYQQNYSLLFRLA